MANNVMTSALAVEVNGIAVQPYSSCRNAGNHRNAGNVAFYEGHYQSNLTMEV